MPETMRAVVVRAPMQFAVEDVPIPEAPEGGFLLDVKACGLCGSDLRTLRSGHRKVTFPWIIGHEICGVVAETGPGYAGPWKTGDLVSMGPVVYCGRCDFCLDGRYELCENYREIAQAWPGRIGRIHGGPARSGRVGRDSSPSPPASIPAAPPLRSRYHRASTHKSGAESAWATRCSSSVPAPLAVST